VIGVLGYLLKEISHEYTNKVYSRIRGHCVNAVVCSLLALLLKTYTLYIS